MWNYSVVTALLMSLAVGPSVPTSDLKVNPGDPEVDLRDPSAAPERRLRATFYAEEDNQPKHVLPTSKQVSAFLPGRHSKRFLYRQDRDGVPISLVVTPCSAALNGTITFQPDKVRACLRAPAEGGKRDLRTIQGPEQVIYSARRGEPGNYDINITSTADTYVHFLATDEDLSGLGSLRTKVRVKGRKNSRAELSWSPGSHGGQPLRYCLITSPTGHFSSVCGGLSAKFGQQLPDSSSSQRRQRQAAPLSHHRRRTVQNNITIGCVGKSTVYTLYDLVPGQQYYVTVFGQHVNSSVSFQYGTARFRYRDQSVRTTLPVRQNRETRLQLTPSRPFRRLELRGPSRRPRIYFYVLACGGPLSIEVRSRLPSTGLLSASEQPPKPQMKVSTISGALTRGDLNTSRLASREDRYQFELLALGGDTTVHFQASWRRNKLRVTPLPSRPRVHAVGARRRRLLGLNCTQLALRMPRSPGRNLEYCVLLEVDTSGRTGRLFKPPSVCGLDTRIKHTPAELKRCGPSKELRRGKRVEVIFDDLIPGQAYMVRAMVRPKKGRYVPYHLSQVTVPPCPNELPNELPRTSRGQKGPDGGRRAAAAAAAADTPNGLDWIRRGWEKPNSPADVKTRPGAAGQTDGDPGDPAL